MELKFSLLQKSNSLKSKENAFISTLDGMSGILEFQLKIEVLLATKQIRLSQEEIAFIVKLICFLKPRTMRNNLF